MVKSETLSFALSFFSPDGSRLSEFYRYLSALRPDVSYGDVLSAIRNDPNFSRTDNGSYRVVGQVQITPRKKHLIGKNVSNCPIPVIPSDQVFRVVDHLKFLRSISFSIAVKFRADYQEAYSDILLIALEEQSKYNPSFGKPTTFILNNIAPRLRNKINRKYVVNISSTSKIVDGDKSVLRTKRIAVPHISIYKVVNDLEFIDTLDHDKLRMGNSDPLPLPDTQTEKNDIKAKIRGILESGKMNKFEVLVIKRKFGFDGREQTLEEIGGDLKLSRERVRQILSKSLKKMSKHSIIQEMAM